MAGRKAVCDGNCFECPYEDCIRESDPAYRRDPERTRASRRKYYQKNRERLLANQKKWREKNPGYSTEYYRKNRDRLLEQRRKRETARREGNGKGI